MNSHRSPWLFVGVLCALLVPGCGDDGSSDSEQDARGAEAASERPNRNAVAPDEEPTQVGETNDAGMGDGSDQKPSSDGMVEVTPSPDGDPAIVPQLVASFPKTGALGVRRDAVVTFEFDRRMNGASVQAAYTSLELPADKVSFSWNDEGTVLTLVPKSPLSYAEGDANVGSIGFTLRIAKTASDSEGHPLAADVVVSFSTLRRVHHRAPLVSNLTGPVSSSGALKVALQVGDTQTNQQTASLVSFDLQGLPGRAELESATLSISESAISGSPDSQLGALSCAHVTFAQLDASAFAAEPFHVVKATRALNAKPTPAARVVDASAWVGDDLENREARANRTQVRFSYEKATDGDSSPDYVQLDKASAALEIVYLTE